MNTVNIGFQKDFFVKFTQMNNCINAKTVAKTKIEITYTVWLLIKESTYQISSKIKNNEGIT